MNILVTGIDGFVGSHLAGALLQRSGDRIHGFIRGNTPSPLIDHIRDRLTLIPCELDDLEGMRTAIAKINPDGIVHLAGQAFVPTSFTSPLETFQTNILGTIHLLECVRQLKLACAVIVVSSGEVYGGVEASRLPIDESFPLMPQNPYAASKACADLLAQQYRNSFGLKVVVARPFNHLGPGQSEQFVGSAFAKQIAEIKLGKRPSQLSVGNLDALRDFTDVRDVVQAYIRILDVADRHAVYNICSGVPTAVRDILTTLRELSGIEFSIVADPERMRSADAAVITGSSLRLREATGWEPSIALRQTLGDLFSYWVDRVASSDQ